MRSKVTKYRIKCAQELHGRILDLGAGEGDFTQYLKDDVISLEPDFGNLKKITGKKVVGSAVKLSFPDNTFDGIWSCAVLEHVEINYIPEAIRVTKPGGTIFILTPNRNSPYDPIKRLFGFGDWWSNEGHVRLYSVDELKKYGKVWGEVWWAPILDQIARIFPLLGHTLMLRIDVSSQLKTRLCLK
jgi:SAM-dependent methyltransferase